MAANANQTEKLKITQFAIVPTSIEKMSRIQLLAWVNAVLKLEYTTVEQLHTGDAYCLLNNLLFPDSIPLQAVKWNSNHEADSLSNWRLLQRDWMARGVNLHRVMPVDRIVQGKYAANYEFLRFFKSFFDANSDGIPRDAVAMRNGLQLPRPATPISNGRAATPGRISVQPGLLGAARALVSHGLLAPKHTQAKTNGTLGNKGNTKYQKLMDEVASLKEKICKGCAPSGDEIQKASGVKSSSESHSNRAPSEPAIEIEKPSIGKVLNARNVIAMAMHADSNSLDMRSAQLLKEACLELIAREWDAVCESAEWKELERDLPKLAADLAFGAATLTDEHTAEKFKEACLKLIVSKGKAVYESAAWKELKRTKPEFALDLTEGATAVPDEKK